MTVSSDVSRNDYDGNGVTVDFPITFRFLLNTDLRVIRTVKATGAQTDLIPDSLGADGFTVDGAGQPNGGELHVVTPPTSDEKITVLCDPPVTQLTDYIANDPFPSDSHERALDKLTMIARALKEKLSRALTLPESVVGTSTSFPAPEALKAIRWKADKTGMENYAPTPYGDVGGANLIGFQQSGTGATLQTIQDKLRATLDVMDFVAASDRSGVLAGTTDASPALQAAIDEAVTRGRYGVHLPAGRFLLNSKVSKVLTDQIGLSIEGAGMGLTQLICNHASGDGLDISSTGGTGNWWLNTNPSNAIRIANLSICATQLNIGTGLKIDNNSLEGRPSSPLTLDHVEIRAASSIDGQAFATGLWLHDCLSVTINCCRFLVGGVNNITPTAVKIDATDGTTDPVNVWFDSCEWFYGGKGLALSDYVEGVYLTNCTMVKVDKGVEWICVAESGLHVVGGHYNCLSYNFDLNGVYDFTIQGSVCFLSGGSPQSHVRVLNGSSWAITGNTFWAGTTGIEVGVLPSGSRGGFIGSNQFGGMTTAISLAGNSNNMTVGMNGYAGVTTRISGTGGAGTFIQKRSYSVSVVPTLTGGAVSENLNVAIPSGVFLAKPSVVVISAESDVQRLICLPAQSNAGTTATNILCTVVRNDGANLTAGTCRLHVVAYE